MSVFRRFSIRRRCSMTACAMAFAFTGAASTASAHGGFVRAFQILNNPKKPNEFVARSDTWGFFYSTDSARTWNWSCAEPYEGNTLFTDHRSMTLLDGGRLMVANAFQGLFYTDTFCDWSRSLGLEDQLVADVKSQGGKNVMVLTSTGIADTHTIANRLWKSDDGGASVVAFSNGLPTDVVLSSFAIAPSNPDVVYALGLVVDSTKGVGFRSADGGKTFARFDAPSLEDAPLVTLRIAAIHPTNPDVVFEWLDQPEGLGETLSDELHFTTDGGKTWHQLFDGKGDLPGLAISPDNGTLAISGSVDGVYTGNLEDVVAADDGRKVLSRVNSRPVWGLLWNENGLYGGNDNFTLATSPESFMLGVSQDHGASFSEVTDICQIQYPTCRLGSQVRELCDFLWEDPALDAGGFKQDFWVNSGRCSDQGGPSSSGGADGSGGNSSGGGAGAGGTSGTGSNNAGGSGSTGNGNASGSADSAGGTESAGSGAGGADDPARDTLHVDARCTVRALRSRAPIRVPLALATSALGLALVRRIRRRRTRSQP